MEYLIGWIPGSIWICRNISLNLECSIKVLKLKPGFYQGLQAPISTKNIIYFVRGEKDAMYTFPVGK